MKHKLLKMFKLMLILQDIFPIYTNPFLLRLISAKDLRLISASLTHLPYYPLVIYLDMSR